MQLMSMELIGTALGRILAAADDAAIALYRPWLLTVRWLNLTVGRNTSKKKKKKKKSAR
jgi:hypothetical protein